MRELEKRVIIEERKSKNERKEKEVAANELLKIKSIKGRLEEYCRELQAKNKEFEVKISICKKEIRKKTSEL
jgi:hypothetical protein